jgi:hypothetical protein
MIAHYQEGYVARQVFFAEEVRELMAESPTVAAVYDEGVATHYLQLTFASGAKMLFDSSYEADYSDVTPGRGFQFEVWYLTPEFELTWPLQTENDRCARSTAGTPRGSATAK